MNASHKHGLMGTRPSQHTPRESEESVTDILDGRHPGGGKAYGIPSYEEKMEEWHETGRMPWAMSKGAPLVPVTGEMMDMMLGRRRRYWAVRRRAREAGWRVGRAWTILRHGYDPWDC